MNQKLNYNYQISTFKFQCDLEKLWKIITDESYINYFLSFNNYNFYKQVYDRTFNIFEKKNLYKMSIGKYIFIYEIENIISTDYYCCVSFIGYFSDLKSLKFFYDLNFFYEGEKTQFHSIYYIPKNYKQLLFEKEENIRQIYYSYIDKFIELKNFKKIFSESIYLEGDSEIARKIIKNSKIFFESFGEVISFTNLIMEKGTKIIVNTNKKEKNILIFNILKVATLSDSIKIKFKIFNEKNAKINDSIIYLELYSIFINKSIINFKFFLNEEISDVLYKKIKFILNKIKLNLTFILNKLEEKNHNKPLYNIKNK